MSLILEALKKSERQRRLGESPSIGSPIMAVRRRRSLLPVLVALIAIALLGLWWMRRASETPPPEAVAVPPSPPAQTVASKEETARPTARSAITFDGLPPSAPAAETAQSSAATRLPRSKVAPDATAGMRPDLREKVKSGELVVANPQLLKPGEPATIKESEPQPASADPEAVAKGRAAVDGSAAEHGEPCAHPSLPVACVPFRMFGDERVVPGCVIRNPVEDDVESSVVRSVEEMLEVCERAQFRVDSVVVTYGVWASQ